MTNTKQTTTNNYRVNLQLAVNATTIPSRYYFQRWVKAVLTQQRIKQTEITVRIVGQKESAYLNETYRHKTGPTNVLSFPFEAPAGMQISLLGDIVICAPVVAKEAKAQKKPALAHWAHMVVHGVLHLLGYDHLKNVEAEIMEGLEIKILQKLKFSNPYQD